MFAPGSRYEYVPEAEAVSAGGRTVVYKLLRTFPPGSPAARAVEVADGDRLDLIAARVYGDPEQFWRICDANGALRADELEEAGRRLRAPLAGR